MSDSVSEGDLQIDPEVAGNGAGQRSLTLGQAASEILWLMTQTASHRHFFLADAEWLIFAPVARSRFRMYRDDKGAPAGCVLWASLSEEVEKRVEAGASRLAPADWTSGENLWIIDVIAPKGKAAGMVEDMRNTVFKGRRFKFHATDQDGKRVVKTVEPEASAK
ncbi:toxin-activating lysine-acyltransferase [Hwanghaeella sp.]|uniref:toxin-activating lysine-acyltransferase n=1 Tax=Hwanghaeella sp. TaxID=2605943 RepID=UPI003CCBCDA5